MIDLAVLGLLRTRPRHGYELRTHLASLGLTRLSFGTLYPALRRLEKKGFIEALRQSDRRKVYQLTDTGKSELVRALDSTDDDGRDFVMKVAFFRYLEPATRLRILKQRRKQLAKQLAPARDALQGSIREGKDDHYTSSLLWHNSQTIETEIEWVDQLIAYARTEQEIVAPRSL